MAVKITKGQAPTHLFILYQDDAVVDLSGGSVAATFRMEKVDDSSTTWTVSCTGLNSSGYAYVPFTTTATATIGEYTGEIAVSGLTSGSWANEQPIMIIIRDSKGV